MIITTIRISFLHIYSRLTLLSSDGDCVGKGVHTTNPPQVPLRTVL